MSGPERIWAWSLDTTDRDNRPTTETGWEDTDHDAKWYADWDKPLTEYVRRDPAVLAELPEVRALVAAETERCAKIAEDRHLSWNDESGVECDVTACADIAAAIREGRG
jgi:hypothetical protein